MSAHKEEVYFERVERNNILRVENGWLNDNAAL